MSETFRFYPLKFVISVLITEGAGGIGSLFTYGAIPTWYATLTKTPLTPPNWLFAPMWITLFFLMGVALYLIWVRKGKDSRNWLALSIFSVQLVLNVLWSVLFFGLHNILFGAIEIVFLWFFIGATIIEFYSVDRKAAYLLFPYISWVTVAALLNITILFANP
jgi:tryptophan-rich sensory protein